MLHTKWTQLVAAGAMALGLVAVAPSAQAYETGINTNSGPNARGADHQKAKETETNEESSNEESSSSDDSDSFLTSGNTGLDLGGDSVDADGALASFNSARTKDSTSGSDSNGSESQDIGDIETGSADHSCSPWPSCAQADLGSRNGVESKPFQKVAMDNNDAIQACYKAQLSENSELSGQMVVAFTISADGNATDIEIKSSTLGSEKVEKCAVSEIESWSFPKPSDYGYDSLRVTHPYTFDTK